MKLFVLGLSILDGIDPNKDGIFSVQKLIANLLNLAFFLVGLLSVIFIIVAGIQISASVGNPQRLAKAKSTLLWAVLGLVVSLSAYAIVNFVTGIFFK